MEFLRSLELRRHFAGKPVVASENVRCFLRLLKQPLLGLWAPVITFLFRFLDIRQYFITRDITRL